jgi:hypothetical protein
MDPDPFISKSLLGKYSILLSLVETSILLGLGLFNCIDNLLISLSLSISCVLLQIILLGRDTLIKFEFTEGSLMKGLLIIFGCLTINLAAREV